MHWWFFVNDEYNWECECARPRGSYESKRIILFGFFSVIKVIALIVICVEEREKCVCGWVIPRGIYESKGVITCNRFPITEVSALMVNYGKQQGCGSVIPRGR